MGYRWGVLATSSGVAPEEMLNEISRHFEEMLDSFAVKDVSGISSGGAWVSANLISGFSDGDHPEQLIEITKSSKVVEGFRALAADKIPDDTLHRLDVMIILTNPIDWELAEQLIPYAASRWNGIEWDSADGFKDL